MNSRLFKLIIVFIVMMIAYWFGKGIFFEDDNFPMFFSVLGVSLILYYYIKVAESGGEFYLRPISGLKAIEEAVGRATEMGKSVLYVPGISDMDQVDTVAGINILGHVSEMTAKYETDLNVPTCKAIVMEASREACRESYFR